MSGDDWPPRRSQQVVAKWRGEVAGQGAAEAQNEEASARPGSGGRAGEAWARAGAGGG